LTKLLDLLPEFYAEIKEFIELTATEDVELAALEDAMNRQFADQFIETAGEQAIRRREQPLGIRADPSMESLDFRRKRLINRYSTKPPFTIRFLQERLDYLVGSGRAAASVDVPGFILTVAAAIDDANIFREVERTVKSMIPAHLVYRQQTAVRDTIAFEEHLSMTPLVRDMRLGASWKLGATPFAALGPEVVIL
jgi:hypothetical protein